MDMATVLREIDGWPMEDRLRLVEQVWDRLIEAGGEPALTQAQREELDRRLDALQGHPDEVIPWGEVQAHVRRPR